jgi:hypothetical protein
MSTVERAVPPSVADAAPAAVPPKKFSPIKLWALLGVLWMALAAYMWATWATAPGFGATPQGPQRASEGLHTLHLVLQIVSTVIVAGLLFTFTALPLIRRRPVGFDGLFLPGLLVTYSLDPLANYFNFTFLYDADFFNRGSWGNLAPGFMAPNQQLLAEPLLFLSGMYVWGGFGAALAGCWFLRTMRAKFPQLSMATLLVIMYVVFCAGIFVFEGIFIIRIFQVYSIAGPHEITVFDGQRYQYPLHEMALFGVWCVTMTSLRYFKDDRGQSLAERGAQRLPGSPRMKKLVSFAAVVGFCVTGTFFAYFVPYQVFSLKADTFPNVPSYLINGICGEGTRYACPGPKVPIPTKDSLSITPDDPRLGTGH